MSDLGPRPSYLFGDIAVELGLLTRDDVESCIRIQREAGRSGQLGAICLATGLLDEAAVHRVLKLQKARFEERQEGDKTNRLFGQIVVEQGLARQEMVNMALRGQASLNAMGDKLRLGELLVSMEILTPEQVRLVLELQGKQIVACHDCFTPYNIGRDRTVALCPACSGELKATPAYASVRAEGTVTRGAVGQDETHTAPESIDDADPTSAGLRLAGDDDTVAASRGGISLRLHRGRVIGPYIIERRLGTGGMGAVYLVRGVTDGEWRALKLYPPQESIELYRRQMEALLGLRHPHIVEVYAIGELEEHPYFEMAYIDGMDLNHRLLQPMSWEEALELLRHLALALEEVHRLGFVHHDVKPSNILIDKAGQAKLGDFDLATHMDDLAANHRMGTPAFMSPEVIRGERAEPRSDLYSLGATLYLMLSGRKPFVGETPQLVMKAHLRERPVPIQAINPAVPDGVVAIWERLMARPLIARYESASELLADILAITG